MSIKCFSKIKFSFTIYDIYVNGRVLYIDKDFVVNVLENVLNFIFLVI